MTPVGEPAASAFPPRVTAWRSTVILAAIGFFLSMDAMLTVVLIEPVKHDMGLSDVQIALLQGTAFGLAFGISSIPLGRLVDRTNRVRVLLGAVVLWMLAMVGTGLASSFAVLVACRILLGVIAALLLPAAISLIADLHPPERRSLSTSLFAVGQAIGQSAGITVGGLAFAALTEHGGAVAGLAPWRVLYIGAGALALLLLPLLLTVREPARQEVATAARTVWQAMKDLWAHRALLGPILLAAMFAQMGSQATAVWTIPILERVHHQAPGQYAGWFGPLVLAVSVAGALAGGQLGEFGRRRAGRAGVVIPGLVAALLLVPLSLFPLAPTLPTFALALGADMLLAAIVVTVIVVAIAMILPNEIRGLALGANIFVSAVVGTAGSPLLTALVSKSLGGEAHLSAAVAVVSVPFVLLTAGCFALALRNGRREVV